MPAAGSGARARPAPPPAPACARARAGRPLRCVLDPNARTPPAARLLASAGEGECGGPVLLFTREGLLAGAEPAARVLLLQAAGAEIVEVPPARSGEGLDLGALLD